MIDALVVLKTVNRMSMLKFFPSDPSIRASIIELLAKMCSTDGQVEWLGHRVIALYNDWPGPHEIRAVLCSKFKPADGISADSRDPRYIEDGIPSEQPIALQIAAGPIPKRLAASMASEDEACEQILTDLTKCTRIPEPSIAAVIGYANSLAAEISHDVAEREKKLADDQVNTSCKTPEQIAAELADLRARLGIS